MGREVRIGDRHGHLRCAARGNVHGRRGLHHDPLLPGRSASSPRSPLLVHPPQVRLLQARGLVPHGAGRRRQVQHRRVHGLRRHLLQDSACKDERSAPPEDHRLQRLPHRRRMAHCQEGVREVHPFRRPKDPHRGARAIRSREVAVLVEPPEDHWSVPHGVVLPEHQLRDDAGVGQGPGQGPAGLHLRLGLRQLHVPAPLRRHPVVRAARSLEVQELLPRGHLPAPELHDSRDLR
mmetsp:Transcript_35420/g.110432  ORF Transcript_35420/g.110432 Transcript_35420/m.110432 type:complete len:235 (-) Transcript_35420:1606-2310(-)